MNENIKNIQIIKEVRVYNKYSCGKYIGFLKLDEAVLITSGNLNCKGIIHVAGINIFWNSSEKATRLSAKNIVKIVLENDFKSVAVPLIGCGANKLDEGECIKILKEEFEFISDRDIFIVKYKNN